MLYAVILSGGSGTRFWPRSRLTQPKQLLALRDGRSLLQMTVQRIAPAIPAERTLVITNRAQGAETRRQLPGIPAENIIIEPFGRDTAPCIGLAAGLLQARDPAACLVVLPADHLIEPAADFNALITSCGAHAQPGQVITLGATPRHPATGFGYIEVGEALPGAPPGLSRVVRFKEKPDAETAQRYLDSGRYLWNCGIFIWRAATVLQELARTQAAMAAGISRITEAWGSEAAEATLEREYESFAKISIDYAVLEHCASIAVAAIDFSWDDLGSWRAIEQLYEADGLGNRVRDCESISLDTERCFIAGDGRLIATIGVEDLIVVQTGDATLICRRDSVEKVKAVVAELERRGRRDLLE